jgi:protein phosphatase
MGPSDPLPEKAVSPDDTADNNRPGRPYRPAAVQVEFGALTNAGKVRSNNEDQYLVTRVTKSLHVLHTSLPRREDPALADLDAYLMLVADGIGGYAAGERASALVVEGAKHFALLTAKWFFRLDDPDENVRLRLVRETLEDLDRQLIEAAIADPTLLGMGTTLTAAFSLGSEVFIVHVGDSRAYRFRDGRLDQLTRDHTLAQGMVDAGMLLPEEARYHRLRHVLCNALGGRPGVEAEIVKVRLADGDRLLLCTDGLHDVVEEAEMVAVLQAHPKPADACQALVNAALDAGGPDNITVVLAAYSLQEDS